MQRDIVKRALNYKTCAIRGSAGSGKTCIAMHLADQLNRKISLDLNELILDIPKVAVATYNRSLTNYLKSHHASKDFRIISVYELFEQLLKYNGNVFEMDNKIRDFIQDYNIELTISKNKLINEIYYIFSNSIEDVETYINKKSAEYDVKLLKTVFSLALKYRTYMSVRKKIDYTDVANNVLKIAELSTKPYMCLNLVVDEVQDLSPATLKALRAITKNNIYYIGDMTQSLYPSFFNWKTDMPENTVLLNIDINYRNSKQIFDAANSILRYDTYLNNDKRDNYSLDFIETHKEGHRPQAYFCKDSMSQYVHVRLKIDEIKALFPDESICIAYRRNNVNIETLINHLKIDNYELVDSKESTYLDSNSIITSSMHSLKGLEFDHVILVDMNESQFFSHPEADVQLERRLMYVAMTRARKSLSLFSSDDEPLRFIAEISAEKIVPIALNIPGYEHAYSNQISRIKLTKDTLRQQFENEVDTLDSISSSIDFESDKNVIDILNNKLNESLSKIKELENRIRYFENAQKDALRNTNQDNIVKNNPLRKKILMLGASEIGMSDINTLVRDLGMHEGCIKHVGYNELKHFPVSNYVKSKEYSDIFLGPSPHNCKGIGKYSSLKTYLQAKCTSEPKLHIMEINANLVHFNKSNLKTALLKSRLYELVNLL